MSIENKGLQEQSMFRKIMVGSRAAALGITAVGVLAGCTGKLDSVGMVPKPDAPQPSTPIIQPEKNISDEISVAGSKYAKDIAELKTHDPDMQPTVIEGGHIEARTKSIENNKVLINIKESVNQNFKGASASIAIIDGDFMILTSNGLDDFHADPSISTRSIEVNYVADSAVPISVLLSGSDGVRKFVASELKSGEAATKSTEVDYARNITLDAIQLNNADNFMKGLFSDDIVSDPTSKALELIGGKIQTRIATPSLEPTQLKP